MDNFIISTEVRIFILQRIETMGACGNNLFYLVSIQYGNIVHRLHLKKKFVARTTGRIAGTRFFIAQNGKSCTYSSHDFYKSLGNALCPIVKRTGTAYPEKYFRRFAFGCKFCECWNSHFLF